MNSEPILSSMPNQYNSILKRLQKFGVNIDAINNIEEIILLFNDKSPTYIRCIISALLWYSKATNNNSCYIGVMVAKIDEYDKKDKEPIISPHEIKSIYISWSTILTINKSITTLHIENPTSIELRQRLLLFSLFTLTAPRGVHDYSNMILYDDNINNTKNYYINNNNKFYFKFNSYKTSIQNNSESVPIPATLSNQINEHITLNFLKSNDILFPLSSTYIMSILDFIFHTYLGTFITCERLCQIYYSYENNICYDICEPPISHNANKKFLRKCLCTDKKRINILRHNEDTV